MSKSLLAVLACSAVILSVGTPVHAYDVGSSSISTNPTQIWNDLPAPFTDFINSVKQTIQSLIFQAPKAGFNVQTPRNIFESVDSWFKNLTGISLLGFIKAIGQIIVWILNWIVKILNWAISFL